MLELVEPSADQRIAALDLVVQEPERQLTVHGLDPEREPAELDRQRIQVDRVDATLDYVPTQAGLEARLEVVVVRGHGICSSLSRSPSSSPSGLIPSIQTSD